MRESPIRLPGQALTLDAYLTDFQQRFWGADKSGCWKLERQQEFAEPGDSSWEAFSKGDWDGALRLMNNRRPEMTQYYKRIERSDFDLRRVRIVQEPISPYLIWELHVLQIRHECGAKIRVIDAAQAEPYEHSGVLPEIFIVGKQTTYQVLYGEDGVAKGAIRTTDRKIVRQWTKLTRQLYAKGEEMGSFFQRKVSGLNPMGRRMAR